MNKNSKLVSPQAREGGQEKPGGGFAVRVVLPQTPTVLR